MDIDYYEASALMAMPQGRPMCLNDWHKAAWHLFRGDGGKTRWDARPFVFRVIPVDPGQVLLTIRSARGFPGASARRRTANEGQSFDIDVNYVPTRRGVGRQKERTPPSAEWPDIEARTLRRAGLEPADAGLRSLLGRMRLYPRHSAALPVVSLRRRVSVVDETAFAEAFLHGVGRKRGYGMGTLSVVAAARASEAA